MVAENHTVFTVNDTQPPPHFVELLLRFHESCFVLFCTDPFKQGSSTGTSERECNSIFFSHTSTSLRQRSLFESCKIWTDSIFWNSTCLIYRTPREGNHVFMFLIETYPKCHVTAMNLINGPRKLGAMPLSSLGWPHLQNTGVVPFCHNRKKKNTTRDTDLFSRTIKKISPFHAHANWRELATSTTVISLLLTFDEIHSVPDPLEVTTSLSHEQDGRGVFDASTTDYRNIQKGCTESKNCKSLLNILKSMSV